MKKRWVILGVGSCLLLGTASYFAWTELFGGVTALAGRDYRAERAALQERLQTENGRAAGADNFFDHLERWNKTWLSIQVKLKKEWNDSGKLWPGFSVPPRQGSPKRTALNAEELRLEEVASARFYDEALKQGMVEILDAMVKAPRAVRRVSGPGFDPDSAPMTKPLRELSHLVRYRMIAAAARGDLDEYKLCHLRLRRIADACARGNTIVERIVAVAVLSLAEGAVSEDLATGVIDPATAGEVAGKIASSYAMWPEWASAFEGESIDAQEMLASGQSSVMLGSNEVAKLRWAHAELMRGADLPRLQRLPIFAGVDEAVNAAPAWHKQFRNLLPGLTGVGRAKDQFEAETSGLIALVAVERYKAAKGGLPESLSVLVPEYLSAVPRDPFGDVIRYTRLEKVDSFGRGYLIYSVGYDGKDNGGLVSPDGWFVALRKPPECNGFDFPLGRVDDR